MKLNNILGQSAFWQVNKYIARYFKNNDTALLLSDLVGKEEYFSERGELTNDGYFYNTAENIEKDTNISYHKQKSIIKQLKSEGFILTKLKGLPAKQHFKVVPNKIVNFLLTGELKIDELDNEKFTTNKNKEIRINNNKESVKESVKENFTPPSKRNIFIPPTHSEVSVYMKEYADKNGYKGVPQIIAEDFMDYYTDKGWKLGKDKMMYWHGRANKFVREAFQKIYNQNKKLA